MYTGLFPSGTKLPEYNGLPKIHKEKAPLRPAVAAFDGPLAPIFIFFERILHQLLKFVSTHIENTASATRSLEKLFSKADRQLEHVIVCTVVALSPSVSMKKRNRSRVREIRRTWGRGRYSTLRPAGCCVLTDLHDLLKRVHRRNTMIDQSTCSRALCGHSEQEKRQAVGKHILSFHKGVDCAKENTPMILTARTLAFEKTSFEGKAREAIETRDRRPEINRNGGWQLD